MSDVSKKVGKSLHINQDVIAQIITNCINEIDGVAGIAPVMKTPRQIWFRQENYGNIRIGLVDDVLSVSIGIILESGTKAVKAAETIQETVKSSIQSMLGLTVAKVNVTVCGVKESENIG
ncbi:MAG: Asp23/Gls24 family envelope stress response protein [Hominimerdicola sp.]